MRIIIYKGWRVRALRRDLMPLATIIEVGDPRAPATPVPVSQRPLIDGPEVPESARQTLMELPPHVVARHGPAAVKRRGHAGHPGRGPSSGTCGSCLHIQSRRGGNRNFTKCELARSRWTSGAGSDVRRKDPACELWKGKDDGMATDQAG